MQVYIQEYRYCCISSEHIFAYTYMCGFFFFFFESKFIELVPRGPTDQFL